MCRRELSLDAPPGVFYKIGAGACLGICKKTPTSFTVRVPVIFTGTFRVRVKVKLRARARARVRVRVRIHQVGYLKIPIYIFWKIFLGARAPLAPMVMLPAASYHVAFWRNIFFNYL